MLSREYIEQLVFYFEQYFFPSLFHKKRNKWWIKRKLQNKIKKIIQEKFKKFWNDFDKLKDKFKLDYEAAYLKDPSLKDYNETIICHNGFYAIFIYRIAHLFLNYQIAYLPRLLSNYAYQKTSIDIHPGAVIGDSFFIDHGAGVVIGETTCIYNNVSLYQGVTLGAISLKKGRKLASIKRHPTLYDNVVVYANASVLGGSTIIEKNVIIGANSVVLSSISENSIVVNEQKLIVKKQK